jgi:hypothetical protein
MEHNYDKNCMAASTGLEAVHRFCRESMRYIQKLKNYYDPIIQVLDFMHEQT